MYVKPVAVAVRSALEISSAPAPSAGGDLPMMPDDAQKCVNSLQTSLLSRNIRIPQPNATCDAILCFLGSGSTRSAPSAVRRRSTSPGSTTPPLPPRSRISKRTAATLPTLAAPNASAPPTVNFQLVPVSDIV
ncbi:uncharacterized protein LOC112184863 [Rosa chinensis]|uniref:uncharacterized protein LOC112184863 n=1 Tax=Rosa chinensis TaxID=74649 RepID=UPI001AD8CEC2|nr:uncharacterized protein LOC112184863 [Rosa chinensis]